MLNVANMPAKIFADYAAAAAAVELLGFEAGELAIEIDPKGTGRCVIRVLDLDDGAVIGSI